MSDPGRSLALDPRKARALDMRMAGMSWQAIADRLTEEGAEIGRETIRRWSLLDDWIAAQDARRAEVERATLEAQTGLLELAYGTLREVLTSPKSSDEARLSATDKVLRYLGPALKSEVSLSSTQGASDEELMARIRRVMEGK